MAHLGWHPMSVHLPRTRRWPWLVVAVAASVLLIWLTLVQTPTQQEARIQPLATAMPTQQLAPLASSWPTPPIALRLPSATISFQSPAPVSNDQPEPASISRHQDDDLALARKQFANGDYDRLVSRLDGREDPAALALIAAALQQQGAHQAVITRLQAQPLTAELHMRLGISHQALTNHRQALFHYRIFASQPGVPASLKDYALQQIRVLGEGR